ARPTPGTVGPATVATMPTSSPWSDDSGALRPTTRNRYTEGPAAAGCPPDTGPPARLPAPAGKRRRPRCGGRPWPAPHAARLAPGRLGRVVRCEGRTVQPSIRPGEPRRPPPLRPAPGTAFQDWAAQPGE